MYETGLSMKKICYNSQKYPQIANSASNNIRFGYGVVIAANVHFCFVTLLYNKLGQRHRVKAIYDQSWRKCSTVSIT